MKIQITKKDYVIIAGVITTLIVTPLPVLLWIGGVAIYMRDEIKQIYIKYIVAEKVSTVKKYFNSLFKR